MTGVFSVALVCLVAVPMVAQAQAVFQNPLGSTQPVTFYISKAILFFIGLMGAIALFALVYGGTLIIIGGMKGEQDLNKGKQIVFWAVAGLVIVGMAATILQAIRGVLF